MRHARRFRFGIQAANAGSARDWVGLARKAEDLGYSTLFVPDHFGEQLAPLPALTAAADATSTLRVGTLVLDNDYRHPVVLAKEAATLDLLSGGRLELGIGAGWMRTDYEQSGIAYDAPGVRIDRFVEGLRILKGLFADGPFSFEGRHYRVDGLDGQPKPVQRPHPPILVGGGGRRVLQIAAREADIVGINPSLHAGAVTPDIGRDATAEAFARKVGWVREAAGDRFGDVELTVNVFVAIVTDDRLGVAAAMASGFGLTPEEALDVPLALVGTEEQIAEDLQRRRESYAVSYIVVNEASMDALAPIVATLAGS